ncbi:MAG: fatty acid-binding protein DegV, partial [Nitrospinaceae bacterium]|nr:fatty acid-binding protein DegV [Nitrospinaceae bacterium]NIS86167.1 fatty acid-binding protein DegV [Nitrospinaceae bacterium]NIT83003.1 fatty acid-binding protein DegV [Nitrospinaceae bacterium]NIU45215.1 fatty acid-binding protein DegV [Nitrospinaceae bacterium]NIU97379.1 fatty acid-binding protein DegV [Nitrospinaceae bacterium]
DGAFEGLEKVRTRGKALDRLVDLTVQRIGERRPVEIAALHANAEGVAQELVEKVKARIDVT